MVGDNREREPGGFRCLSVLDESKRWMLHSSSAYPNFDRPSPVYNEDTLSVRSGSLCPTRSTAKPARSGTPT